MTYYCIIYKFRILYKIDKYLTNCTITQKSGLFAAITQTSK